MKLAKQIDEKTRVILVRYYFPAVFGAVFKLQRKKKYGWRTVSWIYSYIFRGEHLEDVIEWLLWCEKHEKKKRKSGYKIGVEIINNIYDE